MARTDMEFDMATVKVPECSSDIPERLVTRHYENGIIEARDADVGFSHRAGNVTAEHEYVSADLYAAEKARADSAEAKLAKAVGALEECQAEIDEYIRHEYPGDHPVQERYRRRDFSANPARIALATLKGGEE